MPRNSNGKLTFFLFPTKTYHNSNSICSENKIKLLRIKETVDKEDALQEAKRVELMNRLESFSTLFHSTDRPLPALACAKHGWKDTHTLVPEDPTMCVLVCEECQNKMYVVEIEPKDKHKVEGNKLISRYSKKTKPCLHTRLAIELDRKYRAGLFDCHKGECSWKSCQSEGNNTFYSEYPPRPYLI
jgi:hypothetical protein